ncbi:unnamed protein product [marine sediment metagenome]|uniref:Uncharacterized protein n=1 Tax=marine sediment metagenome TaxID=412755 RepID=X1K4Y4_9ZZZZ
MYAPLNLNSAVRKKSALRTESMFAMTGFDINDKTYLETKNLISAVLNTEIP